MAAKCIVLPDAEQDVAEAYAWYDEQEPGLGEEFLRCVDACVLSLCRSPKLYPFAHETYRRALVRRFPYAIFSEHEERRKQVVIYAIFHCAQDPEKWRSRLFE
jgi:plasmid stabilization system protein ParE